jgi:hypothetical protein
MLIDEDRDRVFGLAGKRRSLHHALVFRIDEMG